MPHLAAFAWGKSFPVDDPGNLTHWQPVWRHLDDTGAVTGYLWDEWLAPSVRRLISADLPEGDADGRRLAMWLAGIHDIGKISPAFAVQVCALCDRMTRRGYEPVGAMVHADRGKLRHELAGAAALMQWFQARGIDSLMASPFLAVVGGHHGDFPTSALVAPERCPALLGDGVWSAARRFLLDRAAKRFGIDDRLAQWRARAITRPAQMALTGLVIMADWIASSSEYFPLLAVEDIPEVPAADYYDTDRIATGIARLNLSPTWRPCQTGNDIKARFHDRFPEVEADPRPVQIAAAEIAQTMLPPGLMIIEAPMGEGKTEAALLAAESLAARSGAAGVFLALPTQATSNAMFTRMLDWLETLPCDNASERPASVALVHGKAALNDEYRDIRFPQCANVAEDHRDNREREKSDGGTLFAVVDEWMIGRKRAALSTFVAGTIDQELFAALCARHVMLRQLSLLGKVVVLDEVHAADVYMSAFLDRALEWLGAAETPVVLLSATLPPARRAELLAAYESGRLGRNGLSLRAARAEATKRAESVDRLLGYPSIVATGEGSPKVVELEPSGRSAQVYIHRLDDDLGSLAALLREQLTDGGCAVVIRNTVVRVQETARALTEAFPGEVSVAHAQFLATDRIENDERLLARFGKPGQARRPRRHIVVASQVVEQSLDVDFDLMVTDVAPVDLVLQRVGRMHRHARGPGEQDRPKRLRTPQCWITGVDWSQTPPSFDGGSSAVYGRFSLLSAVAVLEPHFAGAPLCLPEHIAPLVAEAYGDREAPDGWEATWSDAKAKARKQSGARRGRASDYLLGQPLGGGGSLLGANRGSLGIVDEDSPKGQACVRDGGESIEVIVVQRSGDNQYRIPDWVSEGAGQTLPFADQIVDHDVARALARCTLRLPFRLCVGDAFDKTIADLEEHYFPGWNKSPFLSGALYLVLDDNTQAILPKVGFRVYYDREFGLTATKIDGESV